MQNQRKRNTQ